MTRIDFHTGVPDKLAYCCRLARKACGAGHRLVILTGDGAALDAALWNFSATDFLPHVRVDDPLAARTPIVLTDDLAAQLPHTDVLVNLTHNLPPGFQQFARVVEVVSTAEDDVQAGRARFVAYKKQDFQPTHLIVGLHERERRL